MAMHAIRQGARRATLLVRAWRVLRRNWVAFWWTPPSTVERTGRHKKVELVVPVLEPVAHVGLTEAWVAKLHGWNNPDDTPTDVILLSPNQYVELAAHEPVISGDFFSQIDGHVLVGNPYDQNGGAV